MNVPHDWEDEDLDLEPPDTLYHFAPKGQEQQIAKQGLQPTQSLADFNPLGNGVYMYGIEPESAHAIHEKGAGDLYQIDARGLEDDLQPDYELEGAWYHPGPISPQRVRKIAGQEATTPQQAQQLEQEGFVKCRNPQCDYWIAPQEYEAMEENHYTFSCPKCKLTYPLLDPAPFRLQQEGVVGNPYDDWQAEEPLGIANRNYETNVGLTMKDQGQIAEKLVQDLKEIPGYGPITWWSDYHDPIDGGVGKWAIEVKAIAIDANNQRFIPGNPYRKEQMISRAEELGFTGILGILVVLDYRRSVADIYSMEMPLGPWKTQGNRPVRGPVAFRKENGQHLVAEVPFKNPFLNPQDNEPQVYEHTGDDIPW